MPEPLIVNKKNRKLAIDAKMADVCFTCGTCAGGCPVTGVDGFDPRKAIRMAALGLDDELIESRFPWICTLCGRCENQCPMGVNIMKTLRKARTLRARDKVPGPIHKGTMMNLQRGNNLGIPRDDFLSLLADVWDRNWPMTNARVFMCRWTKKGPTSSPPSIPKNPSVNRTT